MLSAAKTSESDTPSVFSPKTAHVFGNSDVFAALNMTKIRSILKIDLIARIADKKQDKC
jgi:hypothetical protein